MSDQKFDWFRILLLAIAVAALLLSLTLVRMATGERPPEFLAWACGQPATPSPLGPGQTDCDKALASDFSKFAAIPPRPIPVATLGMAYFTAMGLWLLVVGRLPGRLHRFWLVPAILGILGLLVSGFFIFIMFKINARCGLCLITHLLNVPLVAGIGILWWAGPARPPLEQPEQAGTFVSEHLWKVPALAILVGVAIGLAQVRDAQTSDAVKALEAESARLDHMSYTNAKPVEIPIDEDDAVLGPAGAPHTVVVFSDFTCPMCAVFGPTIQEIQKHLAIKQYAQKTGKTPAEQAAAMHQAATLPIEQLLTYAPFRIVFKHFPLNKTCNQYWKPMVQMKDHEYACDAAAAAEAARILGGNDAFWKMHDLIFQNRAKLAQQPYKAFAQQMGLNADSFEKTWKDPATLERLTRDMKQAAQIGVRTTPSIYLDGRRIERPLKRDLHPPMEKTVEMWGRLLTYAQMLKASGTQPTATSRADRSEQLRRSRAAAATRATAPATLSAGDEPAPQAD